MNRAELLAPAGDGDAAWAAFHYGADAVYLGLHQFSARAEAANFTPEELGEVVAWAHAAQPRRSVFLAVNTLVLNRELGALVRALGLADDLGVDALIVQDIGAARLARRIAPRIALHASTQMAIHNVEGARALRRLGFRRVTLARELTLGEIREVAQESGLEVEVFIHGALCYAYSGLCLYSSLLRGRSGNRGRCTYPCRERFAAEEGDEEGFPFSMKDLALPEAVAELRAAGVASFKIEGRKKSALYVAATTHYYRRLLDGRLSRPASEEAEADIQTIFARPWTRLYVQSSGNRDVIDPEVVGHRGTPIGKIEAVITRGHQDWLRFTTRRRIEKHDGLQVDAVGENGRPHGFAIEDLRVVAGGTPGRPVFEAEIGMRVEVLLPSGHPALEQGAVVYCSSSQAVKQRYRFDRPRPGVFRVRTPVRIVITVTAEVVGACATVTAAGALPDVTAQAEEHGVFDVGRRADAGEPAIRAAFDRMGDTPFEVCELEVRNADRRFVPLSFLNRLRRGLAEALAGSLDTARRARDESLRVECAATPLPAPAGAGGDAATAVPRWSLKTDRMDHLDAFTEADWRDLDELVVDATAAQPEEWSDLWETLTGQRGQERVRIALPLLMREWEREAVTGTVSRLWQAGCRCWEASNLWAWTILESVAGDTPFDLTVDWPVPVLNRQAARGMLDLGASAFAGSMEDGYANLRELLGEYRDRMILTVYQDAPLFISENCGRAGLARGCLSDGACRRTDMALSSGSGDAVRLIQRGCRTILIGAKPFCISRRLGDLRAAGAARLRAAFVWRHYRPDEVAALWRDLRGGRTVAGYEGNYERGLA
jgi:putative protease